MRRSIRDPGPLGTSAGSVLAAARRRSVASACALALLMAACGAAEDLEPGAVGPCDDGQLAIAGRCLGAPPDVSEVCDFVRDLGIDCVDDDGDCFVDGCEIDLPDAYASAIADCDDRRPDVRPGEVELCDGQDDDCDGRVDEGFDVGGECETACGPGKLECDAGDPTRAACNTQAGQSAADPDLEELCNGQDDDCDGTTDERCRVDLPPAARSHPRLCGEALLFIEAGGLVALPGGGFATGDAPVEVQTIASGPSLTSPTCGDAGLAWLELDPAEDGPACEAPPDGPPFCHAHLWTRADDDVPRDRTGRVRLGPPVVRGDEVVWHSVAEDRLRLQRAPLDGGRVADAGENLSDPGVGPGEHVAVREWIEGRARVFLRSLAPGVGDRDLPGPRDARPGPPALSETWAVWSIGDPPSLWAVSLEDEAGFQVVDRPGPQLAPKLDGERVVWLDAGSDPPALRELDLRTGVGGVVVRADLGPDDFTVSNGVVVWMERGPEGSAVYRHPLPPVP